MSKQIELVVDGLRDLRQLLGEIERSCGFMVSDFVDDVLREVHLLESLFILGAVL